MKGINTNGDETSITKDNNHYHKPSNLNKELSETFDGLVALGVYPHEYFDFNRKKIKALPPLPSNYHAEIIKLIKKNRRERDKML